MAFCVTPNCWFSWLTHGWDRWYVWAILLLWIAWFIWRWDKNDKEEGGSGLFSGMFGDE